jgi:hypothetical protein
MRENPDVHFPDEMTSRLGLGPRTAVSSIRKMNNNAVLGLNAQLGSFGGQQEEAEIPEISEELMLVMALQAQKKAALAPGSNVIVFGDMTHLRHLQRGQVQQLGVSRIAHPSRRAIAHGSNASHFF